MKGVSRFAVVLWPAILFLLAAMITIAIFHTAIPQERRGMDFYLWMSVVCAAEMVGFAWIVNYWLTQQRGRGASGATLQTIHVMIALWFLITLGFAWWSQRQAAEGSRHSEVVAEVYAVLTFLSLFGASAIYIREMRIQTEDRAARPERLELQVLTGEVEQGCEAVRAWAARYAEHTAAAERLVKRLEAIGTSLRFAPPGRSGTQEDSAIDVSQHNARITAAIAELKGRIADTAPPPGGPAAYLETLNSAVDRIESLLRERQQSLVLGG